MHYIKKKCTIKKNYAQYANNMQTICKIYAKIFKICKNMQKGLTNVQQVQLSKENMQTICKKTCKKHVKYAAWFLQIMPPICKICTQPVTELC